MFDRKAVKATGRANLKKHYWRAVLAALVAVALELLSGFCSGRSGINFYYNYDLPDFNSSQEVSSLGSTITDVIDIDGIQASLSDITATDMSYSIMPYIREFVGEAKSILFDSALVGIIVVVGIIIMIICFAVSFAAQAFLKNPLSLCSENWFLRNGREDDAHLKELGYGFANPYLHKVKVLFGRTIRVFLWSLLFFIPGIIKAYQYRMVPYILCDDPNISTKDALNESRSMMQGNKWKTFFLDLSFIGWRFLSLLTLGLLNVLYVSPYIRATKAALYDCLSDRSSAEAILIE